MARYYTESESRTLFLDACADIEATYLNAPGLSLQTRLHNAIRDVLGVIEGEYPEYPVFILAPAANADYAAQNLAAGNDTWPIGALEYGEDISDGLVEQWG